MNGKNYLIMATVLAIHFIACEKEKPECEPFRQGQDYVLSDSARAYVSHYNNARRIIFRTLAGEEVPLEVSRKDSTGTYQVSFPCMEDTTRFQTRQGHVQVLAYILTNPAVLARSLYINLIAFPETPQRPSFESMIVTWGEFLPGSLASGDNLFYYTPGSNNVHLSYLDTFRIADKTFYKVYEWSDGAVNSKFNVKYNKELGIVYLKDNQSSAEYIYERKE